MPTEGCCLAGSQVKSRVRTEQIALAVVLARVAHGPCKGLHLTAPHCQTLSPYFAARVH